MSSPLSHSSKCEKEVIYSYLFFPQTSPDGNVTLSTMVFIPSVQDSGKFLGCRAADQLTGEGSMEDGWKLAITCKCRDKYIRGVCYAGLYF